MSHINQRTVQALISEDEYCATRWRKEASNGRPHNERSIDEWVLYMEDYTAEARTQTVRGNEEAALHTIRKITNMGINALNQHGAPRRQA